MADQKYKILFVKVLDDIKDSKELSYATVGKLTGINRTKIYNIINGKSRPKTEDIRKLLVKFPEYQHLFQNMKDLDLSTDEIKYDLNDKATISMLNDKIALYEETKNAQRETIESLKAENKRLYDVIELQKKLIEELQKK